MATHRMLPHLLSPANPLMPAANPLSSQQVDARCPCSPVCHPTALACCSSGQEHDTILLCCLFPAPCNYLAPQGLPCGLQFRPPPACIFPAHMPIVLLPRSHFPPPSSRGFGNLPRAAHSALPQAFFPPRLTPAGAALLRFFLRADAARHTSSPTAIQSASSTCAPPAAPVLASNLLLPPPTSVVDLFHPNPCVFHLPLPFRVPKTCYALRMPPIPVSLLVSAALVTL